MLFRAVEKYLDMSSSAIRVQRNGRGSSVRSGIFLMQNTISTPNSDPMRSERVPQTGIQFLRMLHSTLVMPGALPLHHK